jgi:hypothetical protein
MALIPQQQISQSGLVPAYTAALVAGNVLQNTGIQYFHVRNESASSVTATVVPVITTVIDPGLGELVKENAVLTLAAGEAGFLGPFETKAFNSPEGQITLTFTSVTSVTVAALYI